MLFQNFFHFSLCRRVLFLVKKPFNVTCRDYVRFSGVALNFSYLWYLLIRLWDGIWQYYVILWVEVYIKYFEILGYFCCSDPTAEVWYRPRLIFSSLYFKICVCSDGGRFFKRNSLFLTLLQINCFTGDRLFDAFMR